MNYDSIGSIRYLIPYAWANHKRLAAIRRFLKSSNPATTINSVFVSHWLKTAAENDLKMSIVDSAVISNGIDTDLFCYRKKQVDLRKRILVIRPFSAINYANDLSIQAILLLSKRPYFHDLQFTIYGEGYLFKQLTDRIRQFPNVTLNNNFIENVSIPRIHEQHGIFLCPSRLDSQGVSLCEAMSSGLVAITSPVGGIPEYVEDSVSGYMVSEPQQIADRIEQLYLTPSKFLEVSAAASQAIATKCALKNTIQQEVTLITSMIKKIS
jgi:glycosyltransferase involved in cell wall biosynthesis